MHFLLSEVLTDIYIKEQKLRCQIAEAKPLTIKKSNYQEESFKPSKAHAGINFNTSDKGAKIKKHFKLKREAAMFRLLWSSVEVGSYPTS